MYVVEILFVVWFVVFLFWAARQFSAANRRRERERQQ